MATEICFSFHQFMLHWPLPLQASWHTEGPSVCAHTVHRVLLGAQQPGLRLQQESVILATRI